MGQGGSCSGVSGGHPRPRQALATRNRSGTGPASHLLIILDVLVRQAHEQLPEVMPLAALPPLHVSLQVSVEALHPVLALLHICRHLEGKCIRGCEVRLVSPAVSRSAKLKCPWKTAALGLWDPGRVRKKQTSSHSTEQRRTGNGHLSPFTNGKEKPCNRSKVA